MTRRTRACFRYQPFSAPSEGNRACVYNEAMQIPNRRRHTRSDKDPFSPSDEITWLSSCPQLAHAPGTIPIFYYSNRHRLGTVAPRGPRQGKSDTATSPPFRPRHDGTASLGTAASRDHPLQKSARQASGTGQRTGSGFASCTGPLSHTDRPA